ncbi:MAG: putative ATPase or kinase [Candidatus Magasanikbacteria bacterium GW2011_GWC2_40_17]|uniref:tRNA threonylcarbamoyladenosine biosynthesis protein TsaE n=1 Tax=Candidatus Magasanikbacteria bacterium GW2011_GWA2_42_32 TaxID=1619039 RepID=A0A0G1CDZ6_9BACT|nr:MAG: putative ATPase or kinase [Candidatus Magasanikbacteria bacterium GW2011_GWC2_40_17]KKS56926.1 MAG: putative ATPase or kinase [Candidatus Magasanikbacteria bacterium GW2011_GWA2_42_32]OGH85504.1 MAG: tRNA (adenosine(37)-N6)-threonylcarbamoyltransferase complex ATPase subunit type 1 TsaE [Candidatus Magasanikbacteria bacterium RIFOXYB2_FULL_38_10]
MVFTSHSEEETQKLGKKIGKKLPTGSILLLKGNLGSGKTTFLKGLAKELGIKKSLRSPTFNLMRVYHLKKNSRIKSFIHLDCYRIKNLQEIIEIGLFDYLDEKQTLAAIEWPEKIATQLKKYKTKKILFKVLSENKRKISY